VRLLSALAIVLTLLAVVGCGGSDESTATTEANNATSVPPTATHIPTPTSPSAATSTPVPTATHIPTPTSPSAATSTPVPTVTIPTQVPNAANCPAAQPIRTPNSDAPPNIFLGTASIDGKVAADGANVTSCIDGEPVASTLVSERQFLITIEQRSPSLLGKEVTFSVDGLDANETAVWKVGGADLIDLSAER